MGVVGAVGITYFMRRLDLVPFEYDSLVAVLIYFHLVSVVLLCPSIGLVIGLVPTRHKSFGGAILSVVWAILVLWLVSGGRSLSPVILVPEALHGAVMGGLQVLTVGWLGAMRNRWRS